MPWGHQPSAMCSPVVDGSSAPHRSLHEAAASEALRFKWLESEKAGRDLGEAAIRTWIVLHWRSFVRDCWIEHLEGRIFWDELDRGDFGFLERTFPDSPLFDEIVHKIKRGGENLDILCWSHDSRLSTDEVWRVVRILEAFDINNHRIECEVLNRLSQAG